MCVKAEPGRGGSSSNLCKGHGAALFAGDTPGAAAVPGGTHQVLVLPAAAFGRWGKGGGGERERVLSSNLS